MEILKDLFFKIIDFVDIIYDLLFFTIPINPPIILLGYEIKQLQIWGLIGGALFIIFFILWFRKKVL